MTRLLGSFASLAACVSFVSFGLGSFATFASFDSFQPDPLVRLADGIVLPAAGGFLTVQVKSDSIVRVTFARKRTFRANDTVVVGPPASERPKLNIASDAKTVTVSTSAIRVRVDRADGAVTFTDPTGRTILAEAPGGHKLTPAVVQGEQTTNVQQIWRANENESLYGLGQRQEGTLNVRGFDFDLWQRNMVTHIPVFVSSRGYGVLWDNTAPSKFGDIAPFEAIPEVTEGAQPNKTFEGTVVAPAGGDFQFQAYSNGWTRVWIDGDLEVEAYRQNWATELDQFIARLEAGKSYRIKVENRTGTTIKLRWKKPVPAQTSMWSEVGDGIDYYFIYGPSLDKVVAGYRALTGRATLLPSWAYGFWQSKNKYNTQDEVVRAVDEFRRRRIPLDAIVQDWQYWPADRWGDHEFEPSRYPDPAGMIKAVHDRHARFMISVWGKFYPTTANYKALDAIGALYKTTIDEKVPDWLQRQYAFYDVFNAPARKMFWDQVNRALFTKGVDAWWMDATEPDVVQPSPPTLESLRHFVGRTASGTASRVMNAYPLLNSAAVFDGQRAAAPDQRVFILTRSGWAGIQRYATVSWSGDITSTFQTMRKQIAAGLGFTISGTPYWASDTGGYTMERRLATAREGEALEEWRELNARWFQYSTFTPILRVHGTDRAREVWNIGDESTPVYQTQLAFNQLRYALFPYIYSLAGAVTHDGSTMMRPLVMDFPSDARARDLTDQYMFGSAFLVCPVTEYKARSRPVYLPAASRWYDFWTGRLMGSAPAITADAPYDKLPLFIRAGSIVPVGPEQQYIGEHSLETVTLYVYAGTNGAFSLYEDSGVSYGYERGEFSRIPLSWNEASKTLTIGARAGSYPGMLRERTFNVVLITPDTPVAYQGAAAAGKQVRYAGQPVRVRLP